MSKTFTIESEGNKATLIVSGRIELGQAKDAITQIAPFREIELWIINCSGGSGGDAMNLYGALRPKLTHATIVNTCASAAVMLAMAAPWIRMEKGAKIKTHQATCTLTGTCQELQEAVESSGLIDTFNEAILCKRTGFSHTIVKSWLQKEFKIFNAEEAIAHRIVDEIFDFRSTQLVSVTS